MCEHSNESYIVQYFHTVLFIRLCNLIEKYTDCFFFNINVELWQILSADSSPISFNVLGIITQMRILFSRHYLSCSLSREKCNYFSNDRVESGDLFISSFQTIIAFSWLKLVLNPNLYQGCIVHLFRCMVTEKVDEAPKAQASGHASGNVIISG